MSGGHSLSVFLERVVVNYLPAFTPTGNAVAVSVPGLTVPTFKGPAMITDIVAVAVVGVVVAVVMRIVNRIMDVGTLTVITSLTVASLMDVAEANLRETLNIAISRIVMGPIRMVRNLEGWAERSKLKISIEERNNPTRYFMVKSFSEDNVKIAQEEVI